MILSACANVHIRLHARVGCGHALVHPHSQPWHLEWSRWVLDLTPLPQGGQPPRKPFLDDPMGGNGDRMPEGFRCRKHLSVIAVSSLFLPGAEEHSLGPPTLLECWTTTAFYCTPPRAMGTECCGQAAPTPKPSLLAGCWAVLGGNPGVIGWLAAALVPVVASGLKFPGMAIPTALSWALPSPLRSGIQASRRHSFSLTCRGEKSVWIRLPRLPSHQLQGKLME